jgi:hypothetical protein
MVRKLEAEKAVQDGGSVEGPCLAIRDQTRSVHHSEAREAKMRKIIVTCAWVVVGIWPAGRAQALTITGRVVDSKARPVADAEVAVCERYGVGVTEQDARAISPVVRTDAQGRFAFDLDAALDSSVDRQRDIFVVTRKAGLAYAWEWLNASINTVVREDFPLVLEPVCPLEGRVVDANGSPVAGAEVQATPVNTWGFGAFGIVDTWPVLGPREWFTVATGPEGRFRFEGLAADGTAGLRVRAPGWGSVYAFRRHRMSSFGFDAGLSDVRLSLPREGDIKGLVRDSQGRPVSGVELLIRSGRERNDVTNLYVARRTQSDQTGTFGFKGIPEGLQCIEVRAPEYGPDLWVAKHTKVSVKAGSVAEAVVRVTQGGTLEVTVLDDRTRCPVPGAQLDVVAEDWRESRPVIADAQGLTTMRVPAGTYLVCVGGDGFFPWESTEQVAEGEILRYGATVRPPPRVGGRVLNPGGQPAAGAEVSIHAGDHTITDHDGRFSGTFDQRSVGRDVTIVAQDPVHGLASVLLRGSSSDSAELQLRPAWTVTGKIADPNGMAISAARVALYLSANGLSIRCARALTGPDGRFEMKAIPPVQADLHYRIAVTAADFGPKEFARINPEGRPGTAVDIGTIELPRADQTLSGIVVDAKGAPAPGVFVGAHGLPKQVDQPNRVAVTDEHGQFRLTRECRGMISLQAGFGSDSDPTGEGHVWVQVPTQYVKIILGKNVVYEPKVSLQGCILPSMAELFAGLPPAANGDTSTLLCLVDIEQRPSRQCLVDLSKKTGVLSGKGVTPVILQVSSVNLRQYQDWLKANEIDMPIHIAAADFASKKSAWGVKALPWLILADRDRVVKAEGFPASEIERVVSK